MRYADSDGDGYGDSSTSTKSCTQPAGYVANADDCDDTNANLSLPLRWYLDADDDGYADENTSGQESCTTPGAGWKTGDDLQGIRETV